MAQTPFLNPNPFLWWYGVKNIAKVRINGESCMALLNNSVQINMIIPGFSEEHSHNVGPLTDLAGGWVACVGLGNLLTRPLGYVIVWVQVDGVQGYDEDQIALVILDLLNFAVQVPVIWETPTISCVMNIIKEKEIDALATPWVSTCVAYLLPAQQATATIEGSKTRDSGPSDYDLIVTTKETEIIDAFSSWVIHPKTKTAHQGEGINIMTQALHVKDGSLPQGLMEQNSYTELCSGGKIVTVVVRNSTAYPQTLRKKTPVAQAVAVTQIPELPMLIGLTKASEEDHGHQAPKLTVKQWQEKLFKELDLSSLESWPSELAMAAQSLLAEYHDVFSLKPGELGCTHSMTHMITVTNDTPFKEWFRW